MFKHGDKCPEFCFLFLVCLCKLPILDLFSALHLYMVMFVVIAVTLDLHAQLGVQLFLSVSGQFGACFSIVAT